MDTSSSHTPENTTYVHGYRARENERLVNQAATLVELLHGDTTYPPRSTALEVGCGGRINYYAVVNNRRLSITVGASGEVWTLAIAGRA